MNAIATDCQCVAERMEAYLEGKLPKLQIAEIEAHLAICAACDRSVQCSRAVYGLLEYVQIENVVVKEPDLSTADKLRAAFSAAPWWAVSVALHALVLLLAGLVSMSIKMPASEEIIMVTELHSKPVMAETKQDPARREEALLSKSDVPPTDPNSKETSTIVVPPDILQQAILGDHFETVNPDRPDTQSAFGNADAEMFHSVRGNDEPPGGGGDGGAALETLIGVGGGAGAGTGGGFGGGDGTGIGIGKGSGQGSFGSRNGGGRKLMVKKYGGSAATEGAVEMALDWLARHQEPDGSWSVLKTEGDGVWDPGVTGLATLAFLGAGHTEKVGKYKDNVKRGVAWIIASQRADGALGTDPKYKEHHGGFAYHHAICALALAEAAGMANIPATKEAAQKAVDYSCNIHQNGEGSSKLGWRYEPKSAGDLSATGWFVMQLKSAKIAGLRVDPMSFDGAIQFLDSVQQPVEKVKLEDAGYDDGKHRYGYTKPDAMVNTTAIGVLCRLFLGWKPQEFHGAAMWLLRTNLPEWRADLGPANGGGWPMYYMYYTTLAMFQIGGEHWKTWNDALKKVLVEHQRKDGDARGSWDPLSPWEKRAGRAYTTALGALSMEVYYRYAQLAKD